ncbi:MAG: hypothetical protein U9R43_14370, partial [Thermodesulfobacteriota bacterium]|nr:hypothetical protein [Thermodesulfobacteriota bacterium]
VVISAGPISSLSAISIKSSIECMVNISLRSMTALLDEHCVRRALRLRQKTQGRKAAPQVPKERSSKPEGLLIKF